MNYNFIYIELIERSFSRKLEGYVEKHHIIPKCMGGTDEIKNIAILTPEEHYLAHLLLVKIYPQNRKLIYAANAMCRLSPTANNKRSNKVYGWLRRKHSEVMSSDMTDKVKSQEVREKIRKSLIGKKHSTETKEKIGNIHRGKTPWNKGLKHTEETKKKISEKTKGRVYSQDIINKREDTIRANRSKYRKHTQETKDKMSALRKGKPSSRKGVPISEETKAKIRETKLRKKLELIN